MERRALEPPYAAVVFDCDSTLSTLEGIEELTVGNEEVEALTARAMDGKVALEEVYGRRLELIRPSRAEVDAIGARYAETAVPGAAELIAALRALGKDVAIVSGGLLPPVQAFARTLGVAESSVHAVPIHFDAATGAYSGFDEASPLARRGGKLDLVRRLFPDGDVALVGDGATDLEAIGACARFVAFAGVVHRASVVAAADRAVDQPDLAACVPHLMSPEEIEALRTRGDRPFERLLARAAAART